jgi:hypothetical protein
VTTVSGPPMCSFCGKLQNQVEKLFAGPGVWICDECVVFCVDVMAEESQEGVSQGEPGSDGSWRIEVQVETGESVVRDRLLSDIASWRRIARKLTTREVDLVSGSVRVQSHVQAGGGGGRSPAE